MTNAADHLPVSELGRRSAGKDIRARARHRLVQRDEPLQAMPSAAKVPDLDGGIGGYFPLEVEEVLFDVGRAPVVLIAQDLRRGDAHLRRHLDTARVRGAAIVRLGEREPWILR